MINRLRRALRTSIRTDFPWETLPAAQVELLQTLQDRTEVRVSDVATTLHLAPSTVSGLFGQMLNARMVARDTDPADRRAARFRLTDVGAARLAGWQQAHERRIESALARLNPDDQQAIIEDLPALAVLADLLGASRQQMEGRL